MERDLSFEGLKKDIRDLVKEVVVDGGDEGYKEGIKELKQKVKKQEMALDKIEATIEKMEITNTDSIAQKIAKNLKKNVNKALGKQQIELKIDPYISIGKNKNDKYFVDQVKKFYEQLIRDNFLVFSGFFLFGVFC